MSSGDTKPSSLGGAQTTAEETVAEASRRWAEFRLAVVGQIFAGGIERGRLGPELQSLSKKKWRHPISGERVTFGFSTIERWYYIVLNNPENRLGALSRRRRDAGLPRSLTKQVRHYLARQAERHSSWSYSRHHQTLVRHMKERDWGIPPGYSTVHRYLRSLRTSQKIGGDGKTQNVAGDAKLTRLDGLVVHLRRQLIIESTQNWLLKVPEIRAKSIGPTFKFSRFGSNEKAYVLSRLADYKLTGGTQSEFCSGVGIANPTIEAWAALYRRHGESGLCPRKRRKFPNRTSAQETKARILEIFHSQPRSYGINRASWTGESLAKALHSQFQVTISACTARKHLRNSGYTMRRARQVLTSSDPDYRARVEVLLQTLQTLGEKELLFFIDELGPLAVKKYGGRSFVKKGEAFVVPQLQTAKGSIILAGALSATTNQMTWCFGQSKNTAAMIDLIELLFNNHRDMTQIYITWDAASWHDSISLVAWLDAFNLKTTEMKDGPLITLVPLPSCSQFLNIIESVFGSMKKAVIHHSDYQNPHEMKSAISQHFCERNTYFKNNPRRAGKKIWEIDFFRNNGSLSSGNYREY